MMMQDYLDFEVESSPLKVVREWQGKYEKINEVLVSAPEILRVAHRDFTRLSQSRGGRQSKYTSEEILRALIVMFVEGDDYRGVVIRIESSPFLREFVGIRDLKPMMDFSFLSRAVGVLSEETVQKMNAALRNEAIQEGKVTGEDLRSDTSVVETNIHYPSDSSLLWDCYRVLSRELKRIQQKHGCPGIRHRFHPRKARRAFLFIIRYCNSQDQKRRRMVKRMYRRLIGMTRWITGVCAEIRESLPIWCIEEREMLERYEGLVSRVVDQADKRVLQGLQVPIDEKVLSIFEDHTELIMRGKARKPVEFGHKIVLGQTGQKFISQYGVLRRKKEDRVLVEAILSNHQDAFGEYPNMLSLDEGFYESRDQLRDLRTRIDVVSMRKKGKLTADESAIEHSKEFRAGQRFRAGIEGCISVLKRAFKLSRCLFKGFKNFAVSVGLAVLCHNLVLLTRL
jgi:IS5 family transposase